jgi:MraZ protein
LFYARAEQCDIDNQGRIRIPQALAKLADLEKELVFIGVGFHWELWNQGLWEKYLNQNDAAFDQLAESTFDPPLGASERERNDEESQRHETNSEPEKRKIAPR